MKRREKHFEPRAFAQEVAAIERMISAGEPIASQLRLTDAYRVAAGLAFMKRQLALAAADLRPEQDENDGFHEAMAIIAHLSEGHDHPVEDFYRGVERRGASRLDHVAEDYLDACFAAIDTISAIDKVDLMPACQQFSRWAKFKGEKLTGKKWYDLYRNRADRRDLYIREYIRTFLEIINDKGLPPKKACQIYVKFLHDQVSWSASPMK